jgi:hypothetical protein
MYQAVAFRRTDNTVHIWDDRKGHIKIKYKPYAYAKSNYGEYTALDGTKLTKVTEFEPGDSSLYESDVNPEVRTLVDMYSDSDDLSVGHRTIFLDIEVDISTGFPTTENAENPITSIAIYDQAGDQHFVWVLDPKGIVKIVKSEQDLTKKIFKIMANGCAVFDQTNVNLKKFSKSSLYNLFYTLSFLLQKGNIWGKLCNIDGKYSIEDEGEFVKWFFDEEYKRIYDANCKSTFINPLTGKENKVKHAWSFVVHNEDQKHSRKESVKGQGGSKYTFADWARVRYLLEDLKSCLKELEKRNIITKLGDRNTLSRDEGMVALDIPFSQSHKFHLDEEKPYSKGGKRELGNIEVLTPIRNIIKKDRTRAPSV